MGACTTKPQKQRKSVPIANQSSGAGQGSRQDSRKDPSPESPTSPRLENNHITIINRELDVQSSSNQQARSPISGKLTEDMLEPSKLIVLLKNSISPKNQDNPSSTEQKNISFSAATAPAGAAAPSTTVNTGQMSRNIPKQENAAQQSNQNNQVEGLPAASSEIQYVEVQLSHEGPSEVLASSYIQEMVEGLRYSEPTGIDFGMSEMCGDKFITQNQYENVGAAQANIENKQNQVKGLSAHDVVNHINQRDSLVEVEMAKQVAEPSTNVKSVAAGGVGSRTMTTKYTQFSLDNQSTQFTSSGLLNDQISKKGDDNLTSETATTTNRLKRAKKSFIVSTHETGIVLKVHEPTEESALDAIDDDIINELPNSVEETECEENLTDENAESVLQKNYHLQQIGDGLITNMVSNMEKRTSAGDLTPNANQLGRFSQILVANQ